MSVRHPGVRSVETMPGTEMNGRIRRPAEFSFELGIGAHTAGLTPEHAKPQPRGGDNEFELIIAAL